MHCGAWAGTILRGFRSCSCSEMHGRERSDRVIFTPYVIFPFTLHVYVNLVSSINSYHSREEGIRQGPQIPRQ